MTFMVWLQKFQKFWQKWWNFFGIFHKNLILSKSRLNGFFLQKRSWNLVQCYVEQIFNFWFFLWMSPKFSTKLANVRNFEHNPLYYQKNSLDQNIHYITRPNFSFLASFFLKKICTSLILRISSLQEKCQKIWPFLTKFLKFLYFHQ